LTKPVILSEAKDLAFAFRRDSSPLAIKKENPVILSEASANVAPLLAQQKIQKRVEELGLSELPGATSRMAPALRFFMRKQQSIAMLFALLLALATTAHPQENQPPTFHVKVHLVNVFVNVTDSYGAPIGGLTQNDFALTEDGVAQKITYFDRETNLPLNLVLAIDTSGSVRKDLDIETRAARDFMRATLRPKDGLDLIDFNSSVREIVPFTADLRHLDWGLNNLDFGPATALYDAIYLSAQSLAPRSGRKVLVVISDGGNTVNNVDFQQALDQAVRDEVMVYSLIDIPIPNDAGRDTGGEHALITLSQETGGKYFYAEYGDVAAAFRKISEDLRTQYLIGYYPVQRRTQSDFRRIQLTLTPSAPKSSSPYTLRYRPGYYATASAPLDQ
jgi:Ca-activated chloride channel family protein